MADVIWLGKRLRAVVAALLALGVINTQAAFALPTGWDIIEGDVTVEQVGDSVLNITSSSSNAVIQYISFNVGAGETVNFYMPGAGASIWNIIKGGTASHIEGTINANGILGIANTAGIQIANTAQIRAAALLATTLNIADQSFLENTIQLTKQGEGAGFINEGEINIAKGGYALIAATGIKNTGSIIAEDGSIHLAVGDKVTFHLSNNQSVEVTVDEGIKGLLEGINAGIQNTGTVTAHTVELKTRLAEDVFANAINNEGIIQATSLASEGGKIALTGDADSGLGVLLNDGKLIASGDDENSKAGEIHVKSNLVVNSGTLEARGETGAEGGHVEMLGDAIYNIAGAKIDVSGDTGGGTALVGGDYQGTGDTYRAQMNFADTTVQVNADARTSGDGGKVVFWADGDTYFYGDIKARGGELAGNGGFAEVSGKQYLDFYGWADLTAKNGARGNLLLDPDNITIVSFDPASLNSVMHLDGSDSSTMSLTGSSVDVWNDATANGHELTAVSGKQPTLVSNAQNGLSVVRFDGSNDYMTSDALGIGGFSDFTNVALIKMNSFTNGGTNDGSGSYIMDRTPATNNLNSLKAVGGKFFFQKRFDDGSGLGGPTSTSNINTSAYQLVQWDRDVGTAFNMWVDGVNESSVGDAGGSLVPPDIRMGSHFSTSGNAGMDMAEYFIFDKQLSTVERQSLEQYLFGKWNVNVSTAKLNSLYLSGTNSVLVDTYLEQLSQTADISLLANNNITVGDLTDNMLALGAHNLTLTATTGNITFTDLNDTIRTEGGDITMTAGGTLSVGHLDTTGASGVVANGDVSLTGADGVSFNSITTNGGNVSLTADGNLDGVGSIIWDAALAAKIAANGGNLMLRGEDVTLNTGLSSAGGNVTIEADYNNDGAGTVNFNNGSIISSAGGDIVISGDQLLLDSAGAGIAAGAGNVTLIDDGATNNNDIRLNNAFSITGNNLTANSNGDVFLYNNSTINMTGTVNITAADDVDANAGSITGSVVAVNANDSVDIGTVTSTAGDITLSADHDNSGAGNVTLGAGDVLDANGNDIFLLGQNVTISTNLNTAGGDLTATANRSGGGTGNVDFNNNAAITTAGGDVTLSGDQVLLDGGASSGIATGAGDVFLRDTGTNNNNDVRLNNGFTLTGRNLDVDSNHGFYVLGGSTVNMTGTGDVDALGSNFIVDASTVHTNGVFTGDSGNIIDIRNGSTFTGSNTITLNAAADLEIDGSTVNATGALTGTAGNNVNMYNNGVAQSSTSVSITAGTDLNGNNGVFTSTGDVTLTANRHINAMDVITTTGNIVINADQDLNASGNFTLQAGNNIQTNGGNLTIRGENITLNDDIQSAGGDVTLVGNRAAAGTGQITMNPGTTINTAGGDLAMTSADFYFDGTTGTTITTGTGDITITENNSSDANDIRFNNGFVLSGNNITFSAVNDIQMQNDSVVNAAGTFTATAGDDIDTGGGNITAAGGNIDMRAGDQLTVREVTVTQAGAGITLRADENLDGTGNVTVQLGNDLNTNNGDITMMGELVVLNDDIRTNGGDVTITANRDGATGEGYINFNNDADIDTANGDINMTAARFFFNGTGLSGLDAGTGDVTITENGNVDDEDLRFDNNFYVRGNNLIATSNHDIDVLNNADINMDGIVMMTAGDEINGQTGSIAAVGDITLNANSHIDVMNVVTTTGDIVISADHDVSGAGNFTLNVGANINTNGGDLTILGENITLNQDIVSAGGDVTLTANRDNAGGEGQINFNNSADISTNNGDINLTGAEFLFDGTGVSGLASGLGDITITENGVVDNNDVRFNNAFTVTGRNLTINAAHDVDLLGGSSINMTGTVDITAADDMTLTSGSITAGSTMDLTATDNINATGGVLLATGDVTLRAGDNVQVSDVTTTTGNIILASDEDLDGAGDFTLNAGTNINSNGGDIDILGENVTLNDFITSTGGDVSIIADRDGSGNGDFTMNAGGSGIITANGNLAITGDHLRLNGNGGANWIDAGTGDITLTEIPSADNDDIRLYNGLVMTGRNVVMNAANDITMENDSVLTASGTITMTAGDDIDTNNGDMTGASTITLTAGDHINIRDITSTGGGNISLLADQNLDGTGNITVGAGDDIVTNGGDLTLRGENITIQNGINTAGGDALMQANRDGATGEGYINFANTGTPSTGSLTTANGNVTLSGADITINNTGGFINAANGDITITENGTVDGNDVLLQNNFVLIGRNIDIDSNADIQIQNTATITASGSLTMDAGDQIIATGGAITATGNIIGNAAGTISGGNMTAGQNLALVGGGNVSISNGGVRANGSAGWNGAADETLVVWSTGGNVTGTGFTAAGAGNVRVQAGSTGNLGATYWVDINDVHASQNASFYASGANAGTSIRVDADSNVAGWIRASGFNASNYLTGSTGQIILQMNTGNLTTGLAWSDSSNITLTTNNGSILQDANGYPWGPGAFWGKTIFTGNGGDVTLTANGGAGGYISTGVNALGAGSNLTARASGKSGGNLSVQLYGRVDGNLTVSNTSGAGNAVTGDVHLGTGLGDPNLLDDVYTVQDVLGTTTVRALGDVEMYGMYVGQVNVYNSDDVTIEADKGNVTVGTINTAGDIAITSLVKNITASNLTSTGGGDIILQSGSQVPRDKMSHITVTTVNTSGNLSAESYGTTTGNASGTAINIGGTVGGSVNTTTHTGGIVTTP